jgi:hypothetical protein
LLFTINQYAIGTIITADDFLTQVAPDINSLKTLYEEGKELVESVEPENP